MSLKNFALLSPTIVSVDHWRTYETTRVSAAQQTGGENAHDIYQTIRRAGKSYAISGLTYDAAVVTAKCKIAQYTRDTGIWSDVYGYKQNHEYNSLLYIPDSGPRKCLAQVRVKPSGPGWQVSVELEEEDVFEFYDYGQHGPGKLDTVCDCLNRLPVDGPADALQISYTRLTQSGWPNQPVFVLSRPHDQGFPFVYREFHESWCSSTAECRDWTASTYDTIFIPVLDTVFRIEDPHNGLVSPAIFVPSSGLP